MKRSMLALAVLCAVASFPLVGCSDDSGNGRDDGHADDIRTDADAEIGADGDGDEDGGAEDVAIEDGGDAEAECGACGCGTCPGDPEESVIGTPCGSVADCEPGLQCWTESTYLFHDNAYFSDIGGYCVTYGSGTTGCDPDLDSSCPAGSVCVYFGIQRSSGLEYYGCMDSCAVADRYNNPWTNNCDCRDGYECELMYEVCMSGCTNDHECCEIWHDGQGDTRDGIRQAAEVTDLTESECTDTCDPCQYRCTFNGCPGGACTMSSPCEHDSDCPAQARCITEYQTDGRFPGGLCVKDRCDLTGRECATGSNCANLGTDADPWDQCVIPCAAATQPGDAGYPCRDIDPPGPSLGDFMCYPLRADDWVDADTTLTGFCWAGNFPGGDTPFYSACADNPECDSPYGLGTCINILDTTKYCTASCNQTVAEVGVCGPADAEGVATGFCAAGLCAEACDPAVADSCEGVAKACYPLADFGPGTYAWGVAGSTDPAGVCFPACVDDSWCVDMWSSGTCNTTTGVCVLGK